MIVFCGWYIRDVWICLGFYIFGCGEGYGGYVDFNKLYKLLVFNIYV